MKTLGYKSWHRSMIILLLVNTKRWNCEVRRYTPGKGFSTINKWLEREGSTSQSQQQCMKTPCPKSSSTLDIEFDRFGNTSLVLRKLISLRSLHSNSVLKHKRSICPGSEGIHRIWAGFFLAQPLTSLLFGSGRVTYPLRLNFACQL